jgi:Transposase domain (DUF772)
VLLKLYIYGYLNRVHSSRRLEREAGRNLELIWLLGRLSPDHKTIADFHFVNVERPMPRSSATCSAVRPLVDRSLTASRRNASSMTRPFQLFTVLISAPLFRKIYQKSPPLFPGKSKALKEAITA